MRLAMAPTWAPRAGAPRRRLLKSRKPPSSNEPAEGDERVRQRVVGKRLPLHAAEPMRRMTPCATIPVGAKGESVPASAPLPGHDRHQQRRDAGACRHRHRGRRQRARSSACAPGPMVEIAKPSTKNMIGKQIRHDRGTDRTARPVTRASVPLHSAMLNRSVTPTSVTSSAVGKPSSTASTDMPPR